MIRQRRGEVGMKIVSGSVAMASAREHVERTSTSERLELWIGPRDPGPAPSGGGGGAVVVEISASARALQARTDCCCCSCDDDGDAALGEPTHEDLLDARIIEDLLEAVTGRRSALRLGLEGLGRGRRGPPALGSGPPRADGPPRGPDPAEGSGAGWGLIYERHTQHTEIEDTRFSAQGAVRTEDGREIAFAVDLQMLRAENEERHIEVRAGDALKDPLALNLDGQPARLLDQTTALDLDGDGQEDAIARLAPGSAWLALDRNGDGAVSDGSELFGPSTGAGFAELAAYDQDGNGWIDEADPVFEQLRLWSQDADGTDHLESLAERGVGAIHLGSVATLFDQAGQDGVLDGQVARTGVFLFEDGRASTIQELDLVMGAIEPEVAAPAAGAEEDGA